MNIEVFNITQNELEDIASKAEWGYNPVIDCGEIFIQFEHDLTFLVEYRTHEGQLTQVETCCIQGEFKRGKINQMPYCEQWAELNELIKTKMEDKLSCYVPDDFIPSINNYYPF